MEKKVIVLLILGLLLLPMMSNFVLAQDTSGSKTSISFIDASVNFLTGIIEFIKRAGEPIFRFILGEIETEEAFIMQILAFLLVMFVVYGILNMTGLFGNKKWLNTTIGAIVAIIGIRFLPEGFLQTMALPSSAFVAIIVLVVPFILLFFLIKDIDSQIIRRTIWTCYGAIILFLLSYNWNNADVSSFYWVYVAMISACILVFWFDGTLQKFLGKAKTQRTLASVSSVARSRIISDIEKLENALSAETDKKRRNRIASEIEDKKKSLDNL